MSPAGALFAVVMALLENMHAVVIDGQASGVSPDEGVALLAILRAGFVEMECQITDAGTALAR